MRMNRYVCQHLVSSIREAYTKRHFMTNCYHIYDILLLHVLDKWVVPFDHFHAGPPQLFVSVFSIAVMQIIKSI